MRSLANYTNVSGLKYEVENFAIEGENELKRKVS